MFDHLTDQQLQLLVLESLVTSAVVFVFAYWSAWAISAVQKLFERKDPPEPPRPPRNYLGEPF